MQIKLRYIRPLKTRVQIFTGHGPKALTLTQWWRSWWRSPTTTWAGSGCSGPGYGRLGFLSPKVNNVLHTYYIGSWGALQPGRG